MFHEEQVGDANYIVFGTTTHPLKKLLIATHEAPNTACGLACLVGYTTHPKKRPCAVYRIQVKRASSHETLILPLFFFLKNNQTFHILSNGVPLRRFKRTRGKPCTYLPD